MTSCYYDPAAHFEVQSRDVEYRHDGQRGWLAHVWEPQGIGPFPALLEVHGGAWQDFDRLRDNDIIEHLASSGVVIAAIDFHSSHEAPYPASIADINYATRWLKQNAAAFNASPAPLGCLGISSGGHQVMLSAMRPHDERYASLSRDESDAHDANLDYLIMGWVPIDPLDRYEHGPADLRDATRRYFVDEHGLRDGNPQLILERGESVQLPPTLLVQGAQDTLINPMVAERFVDSYSRAGGLIEFAKYPGEGHAFMRKPGTNTTLALELMKSFIARRISAHFADSRQSQDPA